MPEIFVTDRKGAEFPVDATNGFTLMEAIRDEGKFDLAAICGGMLSCSTCHVYVDPAWAARLPKPQSDELELLKELPDYKETTSRLSCQVDFTDALSGIKVAIAPDT